MYSETCRSGKGAGAASGQWYTARCQGGVGYRAAFVRGSVMTAKPLIVMLLATLLGPAIGVGLFFLMHTL